MGNLIKFFIGAAFALIPFTCNGQTENPRGVYKMVTLVGKTGEIPSPFDQYKICMDNVTLTVFSEGYNIFTINKQDEVFYHTGDAPKSEDDKSVLIYNSNASHFTEKWWSTYTNHIYFPDNDWCIEKYESGQFSDEAKPLFDVLMEKAPSDKKNPFIGAWYKIGYRNSLQEVKALVNEVKKNNLKSISYYENGDFYVFTPNNMLEISSSLRDYKRWSAYFRDVKYDGKNSIGIGSRVFNVKWESKDCIVKEVYTTSYTRYEVWVRITNEKPIINSFANIVEFYGNPYFLF